MAKKKQKKGKTVKEKKVVKAAEFDKFHRRLGSQGHAIDEVLFCGKPVSVEAIAKATGLPLRRIKTHVGWLVSKKLIKKGSKGNYKII